MKKNDRYTALILGIFGLYIAYEGYQLKLGAPNAPKPGFMIFWMGIILTSLSIPLLIQTFLSARDEKKVLWKGLGWHRGIKLMLSLLIYVAVFKWAGFILSTFLLLLFLFKGLEPQKWGMALLLSAATITICHLVFGVFLELQFPAGLLGFIMP